MTAVHVTVLGHTIPFAMEDVNYFLVPKSSLLFPAISLRRPQKFLTKVLWQDAVVKYEPFARTMPLLYECRAFLLCEMDGYWIDGSSFGDSLSIHDQDDLCQSLREIIRVGYSLSTDPIIFDQGPFKDIPPFNAALTDGTVSLFNVYLSIVLWVIITVQGRTSFPEYPDPIRILTY